jgi:hypothetical protein
VDAAAAGWLGSLTDSEMGAVTPPSRRGSLFHWLANPLFPILTSVPTWRVSG